jgi:hypothetical protein
MLQPMLPSIYKRSSTPPHIQTWVHEASLTAVKPLQLAFYDRRRARQLADELGARPMVRKRHRWWQLSSPPSRNDIVGQTDGKQSIISASAEPTALARPIDARLGRPNVIVFEGPDDDDYTYALSTESGVPALLEASARLGMSGEIVCEDLPDIQTPIAAKGNPRTSLQIGLCPRAGRGEGWIQAYYDERLWVEQVCELDGYRVSELRWPGYLRVDYTRATFRNDRPTEVNEWLVNSKALYDARMTCDAEQLRQILLREGLPSTDLAIEIERILGGVSIGSTVFGIYQVLAFGIDGALGDSWSKEIAGDWPRRFWRGQPLLPIGRETEKTYYATVEGRLLAEYWAFNQGVYEESFAPLDFINALAHKARSRDRSP